jgi:hypothetical protein
MPQVGFEPTISVCERAKTIHALDRAATVIGKNLSLEQGVGSIGLWKVAAPTFSRQPAHRRWWGCQPYAPAALYLLRRFLVLISVRDWVDPRAIVELEGLGEFKNLVTSSESNTRQHFVEPEDSLSSSQEPSTSPYPESDQSSPHHPILYL